MNNVRLKLSIEYDGTKFSGWQFQPNARTVQGVIEKKVAELCGRGIRVNGAGRTDAGVHAKGQAAHIDVLPEEVERLHKGLSSLLPDDIAITGIEQVGADFHARFSAIARTYKYSIIKEKHPLESRYSYILGRKLDLDAMKCAGKLSIGKNSWKALAKEGSSNSDWIVDVESVEIYETVTGWTFIITANRFLRGLVRIWAGTLVKIGSGLDEPELISRLLESEDRTQAGESLPAKGLALMKVRYP